MTLYHLPTLPKPEPVETGKAPDTYGKGRVCRNDGCGAYLSQYNPTEQCWIHGGWLDDGPFLRLLSAA